MEKAVTRELGLAVLFGLIVLIFFALLRLIRCANENALCACAFFIILLFEAFLCCILEGVTIGNEMTRYS